MMKRSTYFFLLALPLLASCLKEENIDVAKPETFLRYYSDGYDTEAVSVEQTKDGGFIILANQTFQNSDADGVKSNIVVIRTDPYGNLINRWYYPANFSDLSSLDSGYVASSLSLLSDSSGYLIVGTKIEESANVVGQIKSELLVMAISDTDGSIILTDTEQVFIDPTRNVAGKAGLQITDSTVLILSSDLDSKNIILSEFWFRTDDNNVSAYQQVWSTTSDQIGTILPLNRLFYNTSPEPNIITGGDGVQVGSSSDIFLSRTKPNNVLTENGVNPIGEPTLNEFSGDFCRLGSTFAFTGSTSINGGDIVYYRVSRDGIILNEKVFTDEIFNDGIPETGNTQSETGNAITATAEGDVVIFGTVETYPGKKLGRGDTDYFIMKIKPVGVKVWSKTYGSIGVDQAKCIRQTQDRGYVLLGTTVLGERKTVSLIKTDADGNLNPE
jgi:hypothetical protein